MIEVKATPPMARDILGSARLVLRSSLQLSGRRCNKLSNWVETQDVKSVRVSAEIVAV